MADLEQVLGYWFTDRALLDLACTHASFSAEHDTASNERLEFLGDAVLDLVVSAHCYSTYPHLSEGDLAKVRAAVVNAASLAAVSERLGLGDALRLGKGEAASGGRHKPALLADLYEAVIGAVYLDGGLEPVTTLIVDHLAPEIAEHAAAPGGRDYKSLLQELAVSRAIAVPTYTLEASGPPHDQRYSATVQVGSVVAVGEGRSKKSAEQHAAKIALVEMNCA